MVVEDHAPGGVAHWQAPLRLTQKMENIMRRKHYKKSVKVIKL